MDEAEFWRLLGESIEEGDGDWWLGSEEKLVDKLVVRTPAELQAFQGHFIAARNAAFRWNLRDAGDLMLGKECSPDEFEFFLAWVIGQGEAAYRAAIEDPDSLAVTIPDVADDADWEPNSEPLIKAAAFAYEQSMGRPFPWETCPDYLVEPAGSPIDKREVALRFPLILACMEARG